jgi:hypothetical protein
MLFPDEALFDYVLIDLAEQIAAHPTPAIDPLPCDRWIARSALQKSCRRGEVKIAQRALANLYEHDRRATWRHIAIIAVEDVGVANVDLIAQIVAAQKNRKWRDGVGGEWAVLSDLVRQIAVSEHCQAACDLLLRSLNDPAFDQVRAQVLETEPDELALTLFDGAADLMRRGIAALALGGGLSEGQRSQDACAVFDILAEVGSSSHVVATCRAAWKLTRNPMTLLLPLVWGHWIEADNHEVGDDALPPAQLIYGVPGYALDQFTRVGNNVSRALLTECPDLKTLLNLAEVPGGRQVSTVGDLVFVLEGGLVRRRLIWQEGDELRAQHRFLPAVAALGPRLESSLRLIASKSSQIVRLRAQHLRLARVRSV